MELDYSQDQINIDYDYGDQWTTQEIDRTETKASNGEDGEYDFKIYIENCEQNLNSCHIKTRSLVYAN